ncbi:PREDICTED: chemokine-like receptor 1 [Nanorana parkeri]|uniref:chemokine-like receptor 1 n=1 Tax=Nanorana parkeri TaxID=125878 RepID=UPI000854E229|nr:PREDICTED: chemokine-like receptor 1 [Nanorana parkeri]
MKNLSMTSPVLNIAQQGENVTAYTTDNISNTDYDYDKDETQLDSLQVFSLVVHYVVFLLGTTGNGLVIFFTTFKIKRTVNIVWILNLAIADFTFSFFLLFTIVSSTLNYHWPFGRVMCRIHSGVFHLNMYTSLFLITVMGVDRCITVVFPVWTHNHRTPRLASIVAVVVWILAFISSLFFFMFRDIVEDDGFIYCIYHYGNNLDWESGHQVSIILNFIIGFLIPFTIIFSCYTIILLHIRRNHLITVSKPFKVAAAIISAFFICWFPFHVISFVQLFHNYDFFYVDIAYMCAFNLILTNSCINPVLYFFIGRDFKEICQHSIWSIFEKAFIE